MRFVLTLVAAPGALAPQHLAAARDALSALGATTGAARWLAGAEAADLPFDGLDAAQAQAAARSALPDAPLDLFAQGEEGRRKKLLLADMDSTIVTAETLDELAAFAGLKDRVAAITARAMNGELDFRAALRERVAMLKGLPVSALEETWRATELMPGARELVATMRAHGAFCALVSGGFAFFTGRVAEAVGFHEHRSNVLGEEAGALAGTVAEPILDKDAKLAALKDLAARHRLSLAETCAVGDGANDLPMILAAGLGVAFRAKPVVVQQARFAVAHGDLRALLFAQGYALGEFAGSR